MEICAHLLTTTLTNLTSLKTSRSKTITIDGCTFHYLEKGSGNLMIFLHGWLHSGNVWQHVADHFSSHFKTIAVDLPGFGSSSPLDLQNISFSEYGTYLNKFITEITANSDEPVIIADSLSAILCLEMIKNNILKYHKLFLIGCPTDGLPFYIRLLAKSNSLRYLLPAVRILPDRAINLFIKHLNFITLWNRAIDSRPLIVSLRKADPNSAQVLLKSISNSYDLNALHYADNIIVLRGIKDQLVSRIASNKLCTALQYAAFFEISQSGHSVMLENPMELIDTVRNQLTYDDQ